MASSTVYTCDHCGRAKGDGNHWFVLVVSNPMLQVLLWSHVADPIAAGGRHICGEECLHAEISSAIEAGKGKRFALRPAPEQITHAMELQEVGA